MVTQKTVIEFYPKSNKRLQDQANSLKTQLEEKIPALARVIVRVKGQDWFNDNNAYDNQIRYEDPSEKAAAEALKSLIDQNEGTQFRLQPLYTFVSKNYLSIFIAE